MEHTCQVYPISANTIELIVPESLQPTQDSQAAIFWVPFLIAQKQEQYMAMVKIFSAISP